MYIHVPLRSFSCVETFSFSASLSPVEYHDTVSLVSSCRGVMHVHVHTCIYYMYVQVSVPICEAVSKEAHA